MIVAHLSDLHLRDGDDVVEFARQLDCIVMRRPDHTVITGDLLDRWNRDVLERALDALAVRELLHPDKLTIIHGNHDLASSGGHPRERTDLWRLAVRFWDPPPVVSARKRRFYGAIAARCEGVGAPPPCAKTLPGGQRLATIESVPVWWMPLSFRSGTTTVHHAEGAIDAMQLAWLSNQRSTGPLIVLVHHYPLPVSPFRWDMSRALDTSAGRLLKRYVGSEVQIPMAIGQPDRERFWKAAEAAGACAVLCGHVHRARLEHHRDIAVGLNGQSGAAWAGRTIAYYSVDGASVTVEYEAATRAA